MAAQVSNDDGKPVLFSGVPGEADQQHTQLNGVLSGLGMTTDTEVTILSDGADGLTRAPFALAPGSHHVMLMGLVKPLKAGDTFTLSITLQKAGTISVAVPVQDNAP